MKLSKPIYTTLGTYQYLVSSRYQDNDNVALMLNVDEGDSYNPDTLIVSVNAAAFEKDNLVAMDIDSYNQGDYDAIVSQLKVDAILGEQTSEILSGSVKYPVFQLLTVPSADE